MGRLTGPPSAGEGLSRCPQEQGTVPSISPTVAVALPIQVLGKPPQAKPLAVLCPRAAPPQRGFP